MSVQPPAIAIAPPYVAPATFYPARRREVRAVLPDGSLWYGVYFEGDAPQAVQLRRCTREPMPKASDYLRWKEKPCPPIG